jgi:hypothetical protein
MQRVPEPQRPDVLVLEPAAAPAFANGIHCLAKLPRRRPASILRFGRDGCEVVGQVALEVRPPRGARGRWRRPATAATASVRVIGATRPGQPYGEGEHDQHQQGAANDHSGDPPGRLPRRLLRKV